LDYNCECAGGVCQNCNEANCNCGQRNYTPHEQTCAVETKRAEGDKFVQDKIQGHKLNCTGKTTMEKETSHNCSEIKTEISVFQQQITELNNSLTKITKELESTKNDLVIERKINADLNNKLLESSKQQQPNSLNTVIYDLKEEVKYLKESTTNKEGGLTIPV
jgi:chromosome segregation ATPase